MKQLSTLLSSTPSCFCWSIQEKSSKNPISTQARLAVWALLLSLLLISSPGHGQSPAWQWATQIEGSGNTQVKNIAVDAAGNSYVVGFFTNSTRFGTTTLVSQGRSDLFVAKLLPNGRWEWAVAAGGIDSDQASGIVVDAAGRIFVAGNFSNQLRLTSSITITSQGDLDVFVAQIDTQGQWQWATAGGGPGQDWAAALTISRAGDLLVAGRFAETASFGNQQTVSSGHTDAFVASLTRTGAWNWATAAGGDDNDEVSAIATNTAGEIYVTGYFSNTSRFGTTTLTGQGIDDAFVGKLSSAGRWLWATAATGSNTAYGKGLVADPAGGVFVTGSFSGNAVFGNTRLQSNSSDDGFVARLSDTGQWQWVIVLASNYAESIVGIALDKMNRLYVTGSFSQTIRGGAFQLTSRGHQDVFVGYIARTGEWLGLVAAGGTASDEVLALALAPTGAIYVGGTFNVAATFGSTLLESASPNPQAYVGRATVPQP